MSGLTLYKWPKTENLDQYEEHEKKLVPREGDEVFIYFDSAKVEGGKLNPTDESNINKVMKKLGYTKVLKFNNLANAQTQAISDGKLGSFNKKRIEEVDQFFTELAIMFLKYLHRLVWSNYGPDKSRGGGERFVLSTLYIDDVYSKLEKGVTDFEKVLTEVVADKYNINIVKTEIMNAKERHDLELDQTAKITKSKSKKK